MTTQSIPPIETRALTTHIIVHRSERPIEAMKEYHYMVMRTGDIQTCLPQSAKGAHAIMANSYSVGIAVQGCFCSGIKAKYKDVPKVQLEALVQLLMRVQLEYNIPRSNILRHYDLGTQGTRDPSKLLFPMSCPGDLFPWCRILASLPRLPHSKFMHGETGDDKKPTTA